MILVENVKVAATLFLAAIRSAAAMMKDDINTGSFKSPRTWTKRETLGVPHPVIASQPEHQKKSVRNMSAQMRMPAGKYQRRHCNPAKHYQCGAIFDIIEPGAKCHLAWTAHLFTAAVVSGHNVLK